MAAASRSDRSTHPRRRRRFLAFGATLALALTACGGGDDDVAVPSPAPTASPSPSVTVSDTPSASPSTTAETASPSVSASPSPSPSPEIAAAPPATPSESEDAETGAGSCSAAGMTVSAQAGLAADVAAKRDEIVAAAAACDYDALAAAAFSQGFTYSYGDDGDPATFWREVEDSGEPVLASLVATLELPNIEDEIGFTNWPSAHQDNPSEADWDALTAIYTDEDIAAWREDGSFLGYRIGITDEADWIFFVAGD